MKMLCPHCRTPTSIRTSYEATLLLRVQHFFCKNEVCGHTFVAHTEIICTLSLASNPNPEVRIPLSANVQRREIAEQLRTLPVGDMPLPSASGESEADRSEAPAKRS